MSFLNKAVLLSGLAGGLTLAAAVRAQTAPVPNPTVPDTTTSTQTTGDGNTTTKTTTGVDATGKQVQSVTTSTTFSRGRKKTPKDEKVVQSKDTKKAIKKEQRADALVGVDAKLPDKQLYDKAVIAMKKGHYDVARLDLQTMLNTYPDSQYQMRAKLAIADSWYKEGGTAALTQAESEYADFRVFFPNVPEAAEAQMRIGDIYFREMDKPDRDYAKATHAEEEYRRMLTDYPDSTLVPQARQRLREVQEVMATREASIAAYYGTRDNYAGAIARYQTVVDRYPLYSHMDDTLIGLGDAFEAEARYVRGLKLPEAGKARLEKLYDGEAAAAYRRVVLEYSAAPHVEDARDRLAAMDLPIPEPTKEQVANSVALENSRAQYTLSKRAMLLFMRTPDVVSAAQIGDPTLADAKATTAPMIVRRAQSDFSEALGNAPAKPAAATADAAPTDAAPAGAPATPAAPLALQDVAPADGSAAPASTSTFAPAPAGGNRIGGVEILTPGANAGSYRDTSPAATGTPDPNGGLKAVGPAHATDLPPVERPSEAPDRPNDINGATTPPAQVPRADGKKTKAPFDKADESSSTHKKKKGIKKVIPPNPF